MCMKIDCLLELFIMHTNPCIYGVKHFLSVAAEGKMLKPPACIPVLHRCTYSSECAVKSTLLRPQCGNLPASRLSKLIYCVCTELSLITHVTPKTNSFSMPSLLCLRAAFVG